MRLTDDLVLMPRGYTDRGGNSRRITLSVPRSDPKSRFSLPKAARDAANWQDVTHVQVRASRRAFVITPCKPGAENAVPLNKSNRIPVVKLTDALALHPGETFSMEIEYDGTNGRPKTIIGEWPDELRKRMVEPVQIRRAS